MAEPYIKAFWSTAERVGSCTACHQRILRVKEIRIGSPYSTQSFRLCDACIKLLIAELKDKSND